MLGFEFLNNLEHFIKSELATFDGNGGQLLWRQLRIIGLTAFSPFVLHVFRWRRHNNRAMTTFTVFLLSPICHYLPECYSFMLHGAISLWFLHFSALLTQIDQILFQSQTSHDICMSVKLFLRVTTFESLVMRALRVLPLSLCLSKPKGRQVLWFHDVWII